MNIKKLGIGVIMISKMRMGYCMLLFNIFYVNIYRFVFVKWYIGNYLW